MIPRQVTRAPMDGIRRTLGIEGTCAAFNLYQSEDTGNVE